MYDGNGRYNMKQFLLAWQAREIWLIENSPFKTRMVFQDTSTEDKIIWEYAYRRNALFVKIYKYIKEELKCR